MKYKLARLICIMRHRHRHYLYITDLKWRMYINQFNIDIVISKIRRCPA